VGLPGTRFPVLVMFARGFEKSWDFVNHSFNGEGGLPPEPQRHSVGRDDIYIDV